MTIRQRKLLTLLLCLYALLVLGRAVSNVAQTYGAGDLYVYWYAGHFIRERRNPYLAYLNDAAPKTPVTYLDGATFNTLPKPWIVPASPLTNTSPYVILISGLSLFNWYIAKWAFFVINVLLALVVPHVALRVLRLEWEASDRLLLHCLFLATIGTRTTLVNGQNALLFLLIMLWVLDKCVLTETGWRANMSSADWLAGLLLGMALSKISLAISIVLLLLVRRRVKVVAVALLVQAVALLLLSLWTKSSPIATLDAHRQIFASVAQFDGIHLGHLLPVGMLPIVVASGLLFVWLATQFRNGRSERELAVPLFNVLVVWSLLFAYHGPYDAVLLLPVYLSLTMHVAINRKWMVITLVLGCAVLLLPGNIDFGNMVVTPAWWFDWLPRLIALQSLVLLGWLIYWWRAEFGRNLTSN